MARTIARLFWACCFSWWLLLGLATTSARAEGLGEVHVCVRPPNVAPNVNRWALTPSGTTLFLQNLDAFREKSRGLTIYVFDPNAPPENTRLLPIPHHQLTCAARVLPAKVAPTPPPPPPPPAGAAKKDEAPKPADKKPTAAVKGEPPPAPPPPPIAAAPPKPRPLVPTHSPTSGSGAKPGPKKTAAEKVAEEIAYAAALATLQLNQDTKRPDGKPYGIIGGTNPNGPNHPAVQAAAGAVIIGATVLSSGAAGFKKKLEDALKKKVPLLYAEMAKVGKGVAAELATVLGGKKGAPAVKEALALTLNQNGAIGPYSVMTQFTEKLGSTYQAHHILEKKMVAKFTMGNADKVPSVILTEAQHKAITAQLAVETANIRTPQELWKAYQKVYKDYPHWLKSIESYFPKGK